MARIRNYSVRRQASDRPILSMEKGDPSAGYIRPEAAHLPPSAFYWGSALFVVLIAFAIVRPGSGQNQWELPAPQSFFSGSKPAHPVVIAKPLEAPAAAPIIGPIVPVHEAYAGTTSLLPSSRSSSITRELAAAPAFRRQSSKGN